MAVQKKYLQQLEDLRPAWDVPIFAAGDIVDRWNLPPEFINWAIDAMPEMYVVAGNHDLPNHSEEEVHRSAFWTLVKFGKLKVLSETPTSFPFIYDAGKAVNLLAYGFGWGKKVKPPVPNDPGFPVVHLAVAHRYVWTNGTGHQDSGSKDKLGGIASDFVGYDVVHFGDNHKTFLEKNKDRRTFFNPGTFLRRKADEIDHKPCVGFLKADGSIKVKYLDVSGDKFVLRPVKAEQELDLEDFVEGLKQIDGRLDFESAVRKASEKLSNEGKRVLLEALEWKLR